MIVLAKVMILKRSKNSVTPMIDIPTCLIVASFEAIASCIVVSVNPSDISTNFSKDIVVCSNPVSFAFTKLEIETIVSHEQVYIDPCSIQFLLNA